MTEVSKSRLLARRVGRAGALGAIIVACGSRAGAPKESVGRAAQAVTASIEISGQIVDATGLPLPGVTVTLAGSADVVQTEVDGSYAFTQLAPGSYSVRPTFNQCSFQPDVVNLNNLNASATQNFGGSGQGCGGSQTVNSGATSGAFSIAGHLLDASGNAVVGAALTLGGSASAIRFTDFTGAYSFEVNAGTYSIAASGACSISPSQVNFNNLKGNATQNFTATGAGCMVSTTVAQNPTGSVLMLSQAGAPLGTVFARIEQWDDPSDALARLGQIAGELEATVVPLTIAGNAAIERQVTIPNAGLEEPELPGGLPGSPTFPEEEPPISLTAAVAIGNAVLVFESQLPTEATPGTIAAFFAADRNLDPSTMATLQGPAFGTLPFAPVETPNPPTPLPSGELLPSFGLQSAGELQIAASDVTNAVVYATQGSAVSYSTDGGQTVIPSTVNFEGAPPLNSTATGTLVADPAVTVGAPHDGAQNFWYSLPELSSPTASTLLKETFALGLYESTDNGQTFSPAPNPFPLNCSSATVPCALPDQPQLAADRVHKAKDSSGNLRDQLYLAWRNFTAKGAETIVVACSADEKKWNVDATTLAEPGADFARLNVVPDGSLLVAYQINQPSGKYVFAVQKFSSCASGFKPQFDQTFRLNIPFFPLTFKLPLPVLPESFTNVADLPGLDRPAASNLSIAADTSDATGQRIFATYVNENSTGSDNVHVIESQDGGKTWPQDIVLNRSSSGHRFFPWICTTNGIAFVTWYDRRAATASRPDLTA
jgi:hypothetical protein